ncbi:hypothetical protein O0L34_g15223 [Tuta absoluta]|nr:hypothetical protein O0L34_g15223 [Tuta absoluta]
MYNIQSLINLIPTLLLLDSYSCLEKRSATSQNNVGDPLFKPFYKVPTSIEYGVETSDNIALNPFILLEEENIGKEVNASTNTAADPSIFTTEKENIKTEVATLENVLFPPENVKYDPREKKHTEKDFLAYPKGVQRSEIDTGKPLFLTPYIKKRNIKEARKLAEVPFTKDNFNITSYSGFLTVDKKYNSHHFFWYFPPIEANFTNNPVVVWLDGGPGTSDMVSLFLGNGPLAYENGSIKYREYNWARQNHVVYIDNPVGVGFSFTNDSRGYCTNQTQVGEHLYTTLSQFFAMFPELQANPLFISGQSYGGKYVPALAYTIHKKNPTASVKMNLKVLHIGNAWIDPEHQVGFYNQILYHLGFLDSSQRQTVKEYEDEWLDDIKNQRWLEAVNKNENLLLKENGLFINFTGYTNVFNLLHAHPNDDDSKLATIFDSKSLRKQMHVGNLTFSLADEEVFNHLKEDMMKSIAPWVEELMPYYHLSLYTGNLDLIVGYATVENFLMNLAYRYKGSTYAEGTSLRTVGAEVAELSEEVIHIAKRYLVANTSRFEESVFGLYLVYCLLKLQPFKGFASLRLVPEDMPAIRRIEAVARRDHRYEVLYVLAQVLIRGPVQYHATNREYGFEQALRKYHEGSTNDKYGSRPKGVFFKQNSELDIIKDLSNIAVEYEQAKHVIRDEHGRMDSNLRYAKLEFSKQLDTSLRRVISGIYEDESKPGDIDHRSERVRSIKDRAMSQKVEVLKHLTTVRDNKANSPSSSENKSQTKPDIISPPGKVKTSSPQKPVTSKRKPARKQKKTAPKRRKKDSSSSEGEVSDYVIDLDDDDIDKDDNDIDKDDNGNPFQIQVELEHDDEDEADEPQTEETVEKEYNIEVDTMPIVIKGCVDTNESQKIEIEFIDHYRSPDKPPEKTKEEKANEVKKKMRDLTEVSFTPVASLSADQKARDNPVTYSAHQKARVSPVTSSAHQKARDAAVASSAHQKARDAPVTSSAHQKARGAAGSSSAHQKARDAAVTSSAHQKVRDAAVASSAHQKARDAPVTSSAHQKARGAAGSSSAHQKARDAAVTSSAHQKEKRSDDLKELVSEVISTRLEIKELDNQLKVNLKKPERRDLKQTHLQSKMRKLGLVPLANFEETKKLKELDNELKVNLKKPERRDLKQTHLQSKMRKLGLVPLANFEETKKVKKTKPKPNETE